MDEEPLDEVGDDDPQGWLHPDDRLWRHPSEVDLYSRRLDEAAPASTLTPLAVGMLGGAIGALLVAGLVAIGGDIRPRTTRVIEQQAVPAVSNVAARGGVDVPAIADRVSPAIVQVEITDSAGEGSASGVIFQSDGHVLTNHHVIRGARSVQVIRADGQRLRADVIGGDPDTDIAVLKVDGKDLPTAVLGSADDLRVGEMAIAIGSPLGLEGGPSVSVGVVSALAREVEADSGLPLLDMIQTDAPISPGSSGGALLDWSGAVIGITTAIAVDERVGAEGLGFATPIDVARDVAEQLIKTGKVVHVWLGIEGADAVNAALAGVDHGALVKRVRSGSPASNAGIAAGDVITSVDDVDVATMGRLMVLLRSHKPGQVVHLKVLRGGQTKTVTAVLAERPADRG